MLPGNIKILYPRIFAFLLWSWEMAQIIVQTHGIDLKTSRQSLEGCELEWGRDLHSHPVIVHVVLFSRFILHTLWLLQDQPFQLQDAQFVALNIWKVISTIFNVSFKLQLFKV